MKDQFDKWDKFYNDYYERNMTVKQAVRKYQQDDLKELMKLMKAAGHPQFRKKKKKTKKKK